MRVTATLALLKAKFPDAHYKKIIRLLLDNADSIRELEKHVKDSRRLNLAKALEVAESDEDKDPTVDEKT